MLFALATALVLMLPSDVFAETANVSNTVSAEAFGNSASVSVKSTVNGETVEDIEIIDTNNSSIEVKTKTTNGETVTTISTSSNSVSQKKPAGANKTIFKNDREQIRATLEHLLRLLQHYALLFNINTTE